MGKQKWVIEQAIHGKATVAKPAKVAEPPVCKCWQNDTRCWDGLTKNKNR